MQYDANTPTTEVTIQGHGFKVPQPFADGHTCNANQAAALNQLLTENVRNNFAGRIKKAEEAGAAVPTQEELDTYIAGYEFGVRSGGGGSSDPVSKEAMNIARDLVKNAIAKKEGVKLSDVSAAEITKLAKGVLDGEKGEAIRKKAAKIVKDREALASDELDIQL